MPLSTLLAPRELVAQLRVASVQYLVAVEEFRGHRYHDDIATERANLPALREVWTPDELTEATADVDAVAATVTAADTLVIMFTSGSSGPPKGVIHSHGNALGAVQSGLAARCIDADTRLYLPMPFFWVGGFGSGILSALLAGATLVTEQIPQPETTLRLLEREQVTLFRGWPDQAQALAQPVEVDRRRPVRTAAGQPRGAAAPRSAGSTRCAGQAVRHDRGVRAVLRLPRRHRYARIGLGSPAASRSTAPRSASSTPTPAHPSRRERSG